MKIGEFANKFDINNSTVRYYIKNGLLDPVQRNDQYVFNDECIDDMEKIIKYKKYRFTISEMQLLFFLEKTSRFNDKVINKLCLEILDSKKNELEAEIEELKSNISGLNEEIERFPAVAEMGEGTTGVPFSAIPLLYCPKCNVPLELNSANISKGKIQDGTLTCECGYSADIDDGVIICKNHEDNSPLKAFNNIESVRSAKDEFSPLFRKLYHNAYMYMKSKITGHKDGHMKLLFGPFTYNFILENIGRLGDDNIIIINDPSLKRIQKIKQYLSGETQNIVYIAGKLDDIPLKASSINVFVDDYSTSNQIFSYNTFRADILSRLLKQGGIVTGLFTSYKNAPKSISDFTKDHSDFDSSKLTMANVKNLWGNSGVKFKEEKSIGFTTSSGIHYLRDNPGENVEVICYHAVKE